MKTTNISQYTNGWLFGDFEPSILRTSDFEVAHHFYEKGFKSEPHIHKIATEYNYIVRGSLIANGETLGPGDMFIYEPSEVADVEFLEDTDLLIVKTPSIPSDKYIV